MTWFRFGFSLTLASILMLAWGVWVNNEFSIAIGIIGFSLGVLVFIGTGLSSIGVLAPIGDAAKKLIPGPIRRLFDREQKKKQQPSGGFNQGNINLKIVDNDGNLIKNLSFRSGQEIIFEIKLTDPALSFNVAHCSFEIYDATDGSIIEFRNVSRNLFDASPNPTSATIPYKIPAYYARGPRSGQKIIGSIEIDVRINFPTG